MHVIEESLPVPVAGVVLAADIDVPESPQGVVLFAHGSGSSRHSPRNRYVAGELQTAGLATVLVDLLTPSEEQLDARTGALRFDIGLLATRLTALTDWVAAHEPTAGLAIGLFGAAVVSRGGRPDLAGEFLRAVHQPTLLIVGERDEIVVDLNRRALTQRGGEARLETVAGATHLFEEPGALEQVARLARDWFVAYLRPMP